MADRILLLVGTKKGAFVVESDAGRRAWDVRGPLCDGWPIQDINVDPDDRHVVRRRWQLRGTGRRSSGATTSARRGPSRATASPTATTARRSRAVWNVTAANGSLFAGVGPAGLFRSDDGGKTWTHVEGLTNHPSRPTWQPGAGGLILHSIVPHPTDSRPDVGGHLVGRHVRDAGRRRDLGAAQQLRPRRASMPDTYPETGQCVHKLVMSADEERLYQQNHCGVYRSTGQRPDVDGDHGRPAVRVRVRDDGPPARPAHGLDDPAHAARGGPLHAGRRRRRVAHARRRRHLDPRRHRPAPAQRLSGRPARGDGPRRPRAGRGLLRDEHGPPLRLGRRRRRTGTRSSRPCRRSGRSRRSGSPAEPGRHGARHPAPLARRDPRPGLPRRTTIDGATVAEVVAALDASWPGVADRLLEPGPAIREHINVFVDGEPADLGYPGRRRARRST